MPLDFDSRSNFLNLALDMRRIIDQLIRYADGGEADPSFAPVLQNAAECLTIDSTVEAYFDSIKNQKPRLESAAAAAVADAIGSENREKLVADLNALAAAFRTGAPDRMLAKAALSPLVEIESRALHNFRDTSSRDYFALACRG